MLLRRGAGDHLPVYHAALADERWSNPEDFLFSTTCTRHASQQAPDDRDDSRCLARGRHLAFPPRGRGRARGAALWWTLLASVGSIAFVPHAHPGFDHNAPWPLREPSNRKVRPGSRAPGHHADLYADGTGTTDATRSHRRRGQRPGHHAVDPGSFDCHGPGSLKRARQEASRLGQL